MTMHQPSSVPVMLIQFLGPLRWLTFWLFAVWLIQMPLTLLSSEEFQNWVVLVVPMTVLVLFSLTVFRLIKKSPAVLLTPIPIFLVRVVATFGVGPLYQWLSPTDAPRVSKSIFPTGVDIYSRVAFLNTTGLLLTLVGLLVMLSMIAKRKNSYSPSEPHRLFKTSRLVHIGSSALILALALRFGRYGLDLPLNFPGFLDFMEKAGWISVLAFSIAGGHRGGSYLVTAVVVTLVEGLIGVMIGIRTEALMPLALFVVGHYIGSQSTKFLVGGGIVLIMATISVTPIVKEVRQLTWGGGYQSGLTSALGEAYLQATKDDDLGYAASYSVWRRLDYSPWQAAMMEKYDQGAPGDTYRYIFWTFAPRFLFPDKISFEIGNDIGTAIQGYSQSSSFSGTVYGEMYWNGGWLAVGLSSIVYGLLLGAVAVGSLWLFMQDKVLFLLVGVSGLLYGLVVDQHFSVSVVGQAVIFFVLLGVLYWGRGFWGGRRRPDLSQRRISSSRTRW